MLGLLSPSSVICFCPILFSKNKGDEHSCSLLGWVRVRNSVHSSGFITRQTKMMAVKCCFSFVLKRLEADGIRPTFLSSHSVLHPSDNAHFSPVVT